MKNPSFEIGEKTPEGWNPLSSIFRASYIWDTQNIHGGKKSLQISTTRYRYGRWEGTPISSQNRGHNWYALTGWVKTMGSNGEVYLALAWLDKKGEVITTSDSEMLPFGANDWQQLSVSALPPKNATKVSIWCISNHNAGKAWFDALSLSTKFMPSKSPPGQQRRYELFIEDYPTHPMAVAASYMHAKSFWTKAKKLKEMGKHADAALLYTQAAEVKANQKLVKAIFAKDLSKANQRIKRHEVLTDEALLQAGICYFYAKKYAKARESFETVISRNYDERIVKRAKDNLEAMDKLSDSR